MMLNKNNIRMIRAPHGDTNYFDIVAEVLKRDILVIYVYDLPRQRTSYVKRPNKSKLFHTKKIDKK